MGVNAIRTLAGFGACKDTMAGFRWGKRRIESVNYMLLLTVGYSMMLNAKFFTKRQKNQIINISEV
jgi:hypothetical protein